MVAQMIYLSTNRCLYERVWNPIPRLCTLNRLPTDSARISRNSTAAITQLAQWGKGDIECGGGDKPTEGGNKHDQREGN